MAPAATTTVSHLTRSRPPPVVAASTPAARRPRRSMRRARTPVYVVAPAACALGT
jgi:hypothetical protein